VYGRYRGAGKATVRLRGRLGGREFVREATAELPECDLSKGRIERMWATRRVEELIKLSRTQDQAAQQETLWQIVRHAGRPGAATEAKAVTAQLLPLLTASPVPVKREVLWMLSEIAGDEAVAPMAALLLDSEVRDDARCALTRMPGSKAAAALSAALRSAPEDFKYALADSLRARGSRVAGYPSRKLVPTKQTSVKAGA